MANKLYAMEQLTEEVAKDVAASPQEWMRFLNTASRLYKYTFPEQLLIYAQRPEATAVASMEIWNQKMYRWIKKGSKGIALIDNTSGPKTKLRYVFDVQDTYKVRNLGKDPQLWNLPVEGVYHFRKLFFIKHKTIFSFFHSLFNMLSFNSIFSVYLCPSA